MRKVDPKRLVEWKKAEPSSAVAARVLAAREIQRKRFESEGIFCNAAMNNKQIEKYCPLSAECKLLMEKVIDSMGLSARASFRSFRLPLPRQAEHLRMTALDAGIHHIFVEVEEGLNGTEEF